MKGLMQGLVKLQVNTRTGTMFNMVEVKSRSQYNWKKVTNIDDNNMNNVHVTHKVNDNEIELTKETELKKNYASLIPMKRLQIMVNQH